MNWCSLSLRFMFGLFKSEQTTVILVAANDNDPLDGEWI